MKGEDAEVKKAVDDASENAGPEMVANLEAMSRNVLEKGMPPKEAFGIPDERIESIYAQAYRLYNSGKFAESAHLFRLLLVLEPTESKHYIGFAACLHMLKEYELAIKSYITAGIVDPQNPIPYFHASDCFIQMRDQGSALLMLEMAVKRAEGKDEYQVLKDRALLTIDSLKKEVFEGVKE
jgi:type III secretion system low calcium response chaperone LcrH/SycD